MALAAHSAMTVLHNLLGVASGSVVGFVIGPRRLNTGCSVYVAIGTSAIAVGVALQVPKCVASFRAHPIAPLPPLVQFQGHHG